MKIAGNSKLLKKLNRLQVFECIRLGGTISKAEIKNITNLTPTTISEITGDMLSEGLILEDGVGASTGGRPSHLLKINPEYAYYIGVDIDVNYIKIAMVSFNMTIVHDIYLSINYFNSTDITKLLIDGISRLIQESKIPKKKIRGIGVAIPALISSEGIIEFAPNLKWTKVDIKNIIFEEFKIPVIVENESRLSAVAERYMGYGKNVDNFVTMNIRSGVGSGIYVKGHLYKGASNNAGELGHITVKEDGPLCGCGNYGCLETMASTPSIIKRAITCRKQGEHSLLFDRIKDEECITLRDIVDAYKDGDELCTRILHSASKYVAIGISSIINLMNPSLIVLGGDLLLYQEILLPRVCEIVEKKALITNRTACEIKITQLGENNTVIGAAIVSLNKSLGYTEELLMHI